MTDTICYYSLRFARKVLDLVAETYAAILHPSKKGALPPITDPLILHSATKLTSKIKSGEVTCEEAIRAYIDRIRAVNPLLNAIVDERFEDALREARELDQRIKKELEESRQANDESSEKPKKDSVLDLPLLGVPVTTKESIAVKGLNSTSGLVDRKGVKAERNSPVIDNMENSGAIMIALSNVPELVMWWDSDNRVYGRSNNPYDLSRITGGSSGGEGCIVSAAGSVLSVSSDIGGSIRMPAAFCGVFAHKTTPTMVPADYFFPEVHPGKRRYLSVGPIVRYAEDLMPALKAMAGPENGAKMRLDEPVDLKSLKIYYMEEIEGDGFLTPVEPSIKRAIHRSMEHLSSKFSCSAERVDFPEFKEAFNIWFYALAASGAPSMSQELALRKGEINPWLEVLKALFGFGKHTLTLSLYAATEKILPKADSEFAQRYIKMGNELRHKFQTLLGDDGIFLFPAHPQVAPKHRTTIVKSNNTCYTSILNIMEVPVTIVPMGLALDSGMPVCIQVAANNLNDRLSIAVAQELEREFGGWVPPSKTPSSSQY